MSLGRVGGGCAAEVSASEECARRADRVYSADLQKESLTSEALLVDGNE